MQKTIHGKFTAVMRIDGETSTGFWNKKVKLGFVISSTQPTYYLGLLRVHQGRNAFTH